MQTGDELYRVTGLTGEGPAELHSGLVGDVFVIGSTEERARAMADAETTEVDGARGAGVLRLTGEQLSAGTQAPFGLAPASCAELGLETRPCEELVAAVEASLDGLRLRVLLRVGDER